MPNPNGFNEGAFDELRARLEELVACYACQSGEREGEEFPALYWQVLMLCLDAGLDADALRRGLEAAIAARVNEVDAQSQAGQES